MLWFVYLMIVLYKHGLVVTWEVIALVFIYVGSEWIAGDKTRENTKAIESIKNNVELLRRRGR